MTKIEKLSLIQLLSINGNKLPLAQVIKRFLYNTVIWIKMM